MTRTYLKKTKYKIGDRVKFLYAADEEEGVAQWGIGTINGFKENKVLVKVVLHGRHHDIIDILELDKREVEPDFR